MYPDTPLPKEEPAGQNPPDGSIIDYYLPEKANGLVTLEINDDKGNLVRKYTSDDKPYEIPDVNIPLDWIRPQKFLSTGKGSHRFMWDMHYPPLDIAPAYPISAIYHNTAPEPTAPWVMPATYSIKLTVNNKSLYAHLNVIMDPRVKISAADLQKQHDLSLTCYEKRKQIIALLKEINDSQRLQHSDPLNQLAKQFTRLNSAFASLFNTLQDADMTPTTQVAKSVNESEASFKKLETTWLNLKSK
jgi:hypothetical protein